MSKLTEVNKQPEARLVALLRLVRTATPLQTAILRGQQAEGMKTTASFLKFMKQS